VDDQEVVEQYQGAVRRYCRRRTWNAADAEDAAQAVLLRWVSRREREVANPEAWLLQAAKWACASLTIRRLHDEANRDTDGLQNAKTGAWRHDPQAIDPATLVTEAAVVREMLRRLPERDRVVIAQVYFHGATMDQLGRRLRCSPAYAACLAQRARKRARAILGEMGVRGIG